MKQVYALVITDRATSQPIATFAFARRIAAERFAAGYAIDADAESFRVVKRPACDSVRLFDGVDPSTI